MIGTWPNASPFCRRTSHNKFSDVKTEDASVAIMGEKRGKGRSLLHMQGNPTNYDLGFCTNRLRGNVSDITIFTTTPERNVSTPITPIDHGTPKKSANIQANS